MVQKWYSSWYIIGMDMVHTWLVDRWNRNGKAMVQKWYPSWYIIGMDMVHTWLVNVDRWIPQEQKWYGYGTEMVLVMVQNWYGYGVGTNNFFKKECF